MRASPESGLDEDHLTMRKPFDGRAAHDLSPGTARNVGTPCSSLIVLE
jgi:hypothetical protein